MAVVGNETILRNSLFTLHQKELKDRYVGAYFDEAHAEHCLSMFRRSHIIRPARYSTPTRSIA